MRFIRKNALILFLFIAVVATGGVLTTVSQRVYDTQKSVNTKSRMLVNEQWELRSLKAEWAYLTRPDRLDQLSKDKMAKSHEKSPKTVLIESLEVASPVTVTVPLPLKKPSYSRPVKHAKVMDGDRPSEKKQGMFSSLLNKIGGGE